MPSSLATARTILALGFVATTIALAVGDFPKPYDSEKNPGQPMPPAEAAKGFKVPQGFHVDVFASEPDVRNPIGFAWDPKGRLWIAENFTYAEREKKFDLNLRDRVIIFTDRDGDGKFDERRVFVEDGKRLTSVEIGRGGVWLMCPPQLLFIPDRDGDDKPDGPPEVVLEGFDFPLENYHNFANGLRFGPDGWLYGRCGASAPGRVRRPDQAPDAAIPLAGGMWRYNTNTKVFEPLCHGTTNPWGHDWDEHGQPFFINTVNGHLWHAIPGAHFRRPHTISPNPYVYEPIEMHADHWHWDTGKDWSDSRNVKGEHDRRGGGHAHSGAMIYLGEQWPESYRGRLMTINYHGRRVNVEKLERHKGGYIARHEPDMFFAADPFFRGIDLTYGPDGSVYILDWSDTGECHENTGVHRNSGRIFRVTYGKHMPTKATDLTKLTDKELVEEIEKPQNEWYARMATLTLVDRCAGKKNLDLSDKFTAVFKDGEWDKHLRSLRAIRQLGIYADGPVRSLAVSKHEHIRAWAIRTLTDHWPLDTPLGEVRNVAIKPNPETMSMLRTLAGKDPSAFVRLTIASTLQRLPVKFRSDVAVGLVSQEEDADDPNIPFLIWYGLIPVAEENPMALVPLAAEGKLPKVREWITRRLGELMSKDRKPIDALLTATGSKSESVRRDILIGLSTGLAGVRKIEVPAGWKTFSKEFTGTDAAKLKSLVHGLDVVFGDGRALDEVRKVALDDKADLNSRKAALQTLIDANAPDLRTVCEKLLKVRFLNTIALRGMVKFDEPAVAKILAGSYRTFHPSERAAVVDALVSRPTFAVELLELLGNGTIPRPELSASQARQIRGHDDAKLTKRLSEVWGEFRDSPKEKADAMVKLKLELTAAMIAKGDKSRGRAIFAKSCANCHRLFGTGGEIGPDLTGAGRKDLDYLLSNIVDPSAVVTKDFQMTRFTLVDGRAVSGVIVAETGQAVTVQTEKEREVIPKGDIEKRTPSTTSLMPDSLLNTLTPEQVRDLIAYLMTESQVELPPEK